MKKLLLTCAALAVCASSAFAVGVDLNFTSCPGNAGTTQDATIDCANGGAVVGLVTFAPAEGIADLVALDTIVDLLVTGGDLNNSANFWDFGTADVLSLSSVRPSTGCTGYTATWGTTGGNVNVGIIRSPQQGREAWGSYRPSALSVVANQKLFGYSFTISGAMSVEDVTDGGTLNGCPLPAVMAVVQATPQSQNPATTTTVLTGPNVNLTACAHLNGDVSACGAVPAARHTWSQLKSLYR